MAKYNSEMCFKITQSRELDGGMYRTGLVMGKLMLGLGGEYWGVHYTMLSNFCVVKSYKISKCIFFFLLVIH